MSTNVTGKIIFKKWTSIEQGFITGGIQVCLRRIKKIKTLCRLQFYSTVHVSIKTKLLIFVEVIMRPNKMMMMLTVWPRGWSKEHMGTYWAVHRGSVIIKWSRIPRIESQYPRKFLIRSPAVDVMTHGHHRQGLSCQ